VSFFLKKIRHLVGEEQIWKVVSFLLSASWMQDFSTSVFFDGIYRHAAFTCGTWSLFSETSHCPMKYRGFQKNTCHGDFFQQIEDASSTGSWTQGIPGSGCSSVNTSCFIPWN
jgi:hypothetical protein